MLLAARYRCKTDVVGGRADLPPISIPTYQHNVAYDAKPAVRQPDDNYDGMPAPKQPHVTKP